MKKITSYVKDLADYMTTSRQKKKQQDDQSSEKDVKDKKKLKRSSILGIRG